MFREKIGLNDIDSKYLEQVNSYKYLESVVNREDSREEEIEERIAVGSRACYAN